MPTYAYRCPKCGNSYDKFQKISDQTRAKCPSCGTRGERLITGGAGLVFKGSGFYITDYKRKGSEDQKQKEEKKKPEKKPDGGTSSSDKPSKSAGADN